MGDSVSFTDVRLEESTIDRAAEALRSGRYVKGPLVERFEEAFAEYCGTEHAVGVASGTDALSLALQAAGVVSGDEVFVPGHTFFATASPVLELGAEPVFVDVDPVSYTMRPPDLESKVRAADDPAAVVPVHLYGHPASMGAIRDVASDHDLALVADACQAHGAAYDGDRVGSIGDVGCFSFYPSKNMTVAGDGGMVATDDPDLARAIRMRRNHGRNDQGQHVRLGLNHRMGEVQAAVGIEQLAGLDAANEKRRAAGARYEDRLADVDEVTVPDERADAHHVYHLYVVQVPDRDDLQATLESAGIGTGIHYETPLYDHPAVRRRLDTTPSLTRTELLTDRILSLPMHPGLDASAVERVCDEIRRHYER
jgi:dTDP-4-amino-4,6-dideoxygalactose transaminase